jgi:4-amino-4-deoxy-L-arabinose transferase-like glycosyltransferase
MAGAVLALTPVATLMFRFNNPDALLVLLLVGSAYATLRAVEGSLATGTPHTRWLVLGGALVGLAFLTKMLQAFLVLPALALAYLVFAGVPLARRVVPLLAALVSMVLAAGWWVAIVELWPTSARPWIGGSQDNSILELTLGYNGLGRLTGDETGSVGGNGGWGETGLFRMFNSEIGSQIGWLLPAALVLGVAGLWFARHLDAGTESAARIRRLVQAGLTLWLGWLLLTLLTFSYMAGIFHAYYTVALAPAIGALVALGGWVLWRQRTSYAAAALLAFTTALSTAWAFVLLDRNSDYLPWLKYLVATVGFAAALMLAGVRHLPRRVGTAVAATALVATLAAPAAYSLETAATAHTGSIPTAGPSAGGGMGGPGGGGGAPGGPDGTTTGGGVGGLLTGSTPTAQLTAMLQQDASSWTWSAAVVGANSAAGYQLASGEPVMALGGFNGSDPSVTLAQFQEYVANGDIHYFISGGGGIGGGPGGMGDGQGTSTSSEIASWVASSFTATTVDGVTVYDLSGGVQ